MAARALTDSSRPTPSGSALLDSAPKGSALNAAPQGTALLDAAPRGSALLDATPKGSALLDATPKGSALLDAAPRGSALPKATSPLGGKSPAPGACVVYLPTLALQVLWRARPEWRNDPVAVVADETPEAPLLVLSKQAYARGLRPGIRQGAARNLALDLRTAVVREDEIEALCDDIARSLQTFSPRVERVKGFVGAFFLDPSGLDLLYGGQDAWARTVHRYLRGRKLLATLVVGFERYRGLALAHAQRPGFYVFKSADEERALSDAVELRLLGFPEKLCDPLSMLSIDRLGEFLALPPGELLTRFGRDAANLHACFSAERQLPLQPMGFDVPRRVTMEVLPPDTDRERLLFSIKSALDPLLVEIEHKGEQVAALNIELHLERYGNRRLLDEERTVHARLEPASPTLDAHSLLDLIRLRLTKLTLPAPVEELAIEAEVVVARGQQLDTITERPRRDPHAAATALAKVVASFGKRSVCRAVIRDAHLPEAQYIWAPFDNAAEALRESAFSKTSSANRVSSDRPSSDRPSSDRSSLSRSSSSHASFSNAPSSNAPSSNASLNALSSSTPSSKPSPSKSSSLNRASLNASSLISFSGALDTSSPITAQRRLLPSPEPLASDGAGGFAWHETVTKKEGPYRMNGGWWGKETSGAPSIDRDYYYAFAESGEVLWVFFDRRRKRWFLHGRIE